MRTLIKVLAAMLVLGFSLPAKSMLAYVDDSVLDSMRGRYVDAGQIVRFGVQMLSTWQNAAGVVQGAGVQLSAQAGAVPVIHRYTLNSTSATNHAVSSMPAGLASVQGTVQINQQAGNGNISRNITRVDIDDGAAPVSMPAGWQASAQGSAVTNGQLGVSINMGSAGQMGQYLGQGQLMQFSRITGNGIITNNSLHIQLAVQSQAGLIRFTMPSRAMMAGIGLR
ncbi:hypothetical protein CR207_03195 [Chromobacterium violaceum]|uniref:hypothetical protein n=1 Tax=Chromobacterium violaceum TaxID=536 RepID=UPI000C126747|nr:hypothetical protein [Chromobacterium violaceum]ATP27487.1 hypothetical protein CRN81_03175 [Chromobacterium violaceum]ATP31404.1 hypothetical protein CR207_03195 [Chromobacterium violaceum]